MFASFDDNAPFGSCLLRLLGQCALKSVDHLPLAPPQSGKMDADPEKTGIMFNPLICKWHMRGGLRGCRPRLA